MTGETRGAAVVRARSLDRCEVCGRRKGDSFGHRVKRSQGGTWAPSNGIRLCGDGTRGCHGWCEAHPVLAQTFGWALPGHADPAASPALLRPAMWAPGWYLLRDNGDYTWVDSPDQPNPYTGEVPLEGLSPWPEGLR